MKWVHGDHVELVANDDYFRGKPQTAPDHRARRARREHVDQPAAQHASRLDLRSVAGDDQRAAPARCGRHDQARLRRCALDVSPLHEHLAARAARRARASGDRLRDRQEAARRPAHRRHRRRRHLPISRRSHPTTSPTSRSTRPIRRRRARSCARPATRFGPDGMAQKNGRPLSLQISYNVENATRRSIAIQVQAELKAIGIDAPLKELSGQPDVRDVRTRRDFDQREIRSERHRAGRQASIRTTTRFTAATSFRRPVRTTRDIVRRKCNGCNAWR